MQKLLPSSRSILLSFALVAAWVGVSSAQDSTATPMQQKVLAILAPVVETSRERDSLAVLADTARGENSVMFEEQVWQRQLNFQAELLKATAELEKLKGQGADLSSARAMLDQAVRTGWPRYLRQLDRRTAVMAGLTQKRDEADASHRPMIESEISEYSDRTAKMYRDLVEAMLSVERLGVGLTSQRAFMVKHLQTTAAQTSARLVILGRSHALASARAQHAPEDAGARAELDALNASLDRTVRNLETEIALLERLGTDATDLKVTQIVNTGSLTAAVLQPRVISGLFAYWREQLGERISTHGAHWLFQLFMIALILVGFGLIGKMVQRLVRHGIARAQFSQLLKDTVTSWSYRLVMVIAIVFVLQQLGVQLAPMLAGLGIAGFVVGFALQDTLANFAAGGMILAYRPYDVGDVIEAGGAMGKVQKMSLVSTTVLTFDNQTLIVPNRKMWGDIIRNFTAQDRRRVDLTFGVGYEDDVAKVERLLKEIVEADSRVLHEPPPVIRLHELADSSMNFVVRVWTLQANYWDVYWDLIRAVKLRFDAEGIKIPFPQRELHVNMPRDLQGENNGSPTAAESKQNQLS